MDIDEKWHYYLKYDADTQLAYQFLESCSEDAKLELKRVFEAFGDSSKLPAIAEKIYLEYSGCSPITEEDVIAKYGVSKVDGRYAHGYYLFDTLEQVVAHFDPERAKTILPDSEATRAYETSFGLINPSMVCIHCKSKGGVRTKRIEKKAGISGGKAAAAVITGGISVIATGLSRIEGLTQAYCEHCRNTWTF